MPARGHRQVVVGPVGMPSAALGARGRRARSRAATGTPRLRVRAVRCRSTLRHDEHASPSGWAAGFPVPPDSVWSSRAHADGTRAQARQKAPVVTTPSRRRRDPLIGEAAPARRCSAACELRRQRDRSQPCVRAGEGVSHAPKRWCRGSCSAPGRDVEQCHRRTSDGPRAGTDCQWRPAQLSVRRPCDERRTTADTTVGTILSAELGVGRAPRRTRGARGQRDKPRRGRARGHCRQGRPHHDRPQRVLRED
jgi:hypothetical protein